MSKLIGISGFATVGKSTFSDLSCKHLSEKYNLKCCSINFAAQLKDDLFPLLRDSFGLDIKNLKPELKSQCRPLMVEYGKLARLWSKDGNYWIDKLEQKIKEDKLEENYEILFIPDVRYCNEVKFIRSRLGSIINIERIAKEKYRMVGQLTIENKAFGPANEEEAKEAPKVAAMADIRAKWFDAKDNYKELEEYVEHFWKINFNRLAA